MMKGGHGQTISYMALIGMHEMSSALYVCACVYVGKELGIAPMYVFTIA